MELRRAKINDNFFCERSEKDNFYCRCCFKMFTSFCNQNEIQKSFISNIQDLFQRPISFSKGSRYICDLCNNTVTVFWKFKNDIIEKQDKFSQMIASNQHQDIKNIQKLMDPEEQELQKQEIVMIKEESHSFDNIFDGFDADMPDEVEEKQEPMKTRKRKVPKISKEPPKKKPSKKADQLPNIVSQSLPSHQIENRGLEKTFRCSFCEFSSSSNRITYRHVRKVHHDSKKERKTCGICGKNFKSLNDHIQNVHKGVRNYFCDLCDFSSYTKESLLSHMRSKHLPKGFKCPKCDYRAIDTRRLKYHIYIQHESIDKVPAIFKKIKKLVNCPHCDKVLQGEFSLSYHIKRIHERKDLSFKCEAPNCLKAFYSPADRKTHFERCHGPRNMICESCGAAFISEKALQAHMTMHVDLDISCKICNDKFKNQNLLKCHINRMHVSDKNFKCDQPKCKAAFFYSTDLMRHMTSKHSGIKFDCEIEGCKSSLVRSDSYRIHLQKCHMKLKPNQVEEFVKRGQRIVNEKIKMLSS